MSARPLVWAMHDGRVGIANQVIGLTEAVGLEGLRRRNDFVIGSVLLLRSAALTDVGPFDERLLIINTIIKPGFATARALSNALVPPHLL